MDDNEGNQTPISRHDSVASLEKPKKKKLTKKQRAAAAKAQEEKRKAEERQREAREREQMSVVESESKAYEREVKYQLEEKERRDWEQHQVNVWDELLEKNKEEWRRRTKEQRTWKQYVKGTSQVNPAVEAEINTWVNLWKEREELGMEETLSSCQEAEDIIKEIELLMPEAKRINETLYNRLAQNVDELRDLQVQKIDQLTAHIMRIADEFATPKNEVLLAHKTDDIKYGLWVNLSKNPRIKRIDFTSLALSTGLPKNLALTSVAVRMIHFNCDPISYKYPSEFISLGGVLFLELLALPPPPKKVKGWTLRQVTSLSTTVSRLPYPPSTGIGVEAAAINQLVSQPGGLSGWPPLRISYMLPANIIVRDNSPTIGWWDADNKAWKTNGISEIEFDPPTKTIVFKTVHVTALSIIQLRFIDFPYNSWEIRPSGKNEAVMTLKTKGHKEVQIKIGEGYCRLFRCRDRELRELESIKFTPIGLLQKISSCGVNIMPDDQTSTHLKDIIMTKDAALEKKLYKDIACMVSAFSFKHSKWNNQKHGEKKFVFGIKETLVWGEIEKEKSTDKHVDESNENAGDRDEDDDSVWKSCLYQERSCILIRASEKSSKYNEDLLKSAKIHQHLYHCLMSQKSSDLAEKRVKGASVAFTETVQELFGLLRPLSFSK